MRNPFLAILLSSFIALGASAAEPEPFWKAKPKVYERIENREVIVSVTSVSVSGEKFKNHLKVEGGGQVRTPRSFLFERAQHYDELKRSSYVKQADYDPKTRLLKLKIEAFGHSAAMKVKLSPHPGDERDRIDFSVVEGTLKGLAGQLLFSSISTVKSEVGIHADYQYDRFPIPKLFLEFGMEVVFQKMAVFLRQYVEEQYEQAKAKP